MLLERGIEPVVSGLLGRHKVVVLEGARSVGKTTLARKIAADMEGIYLDLSDASIRAAVESDPEATLGGRRGVVVVDEAQLIETLTLDVKRIVDSGSENGQFLLTGSSRLSRGALGGSDPLAGRAARATMRPLTVGERLGTPIDRVTPWLQGDVAAGANPTLDHEDLVRFVVQGGLPGLVTAQPLATPSSEWWATAAEAMPVYLDSALSLLYSKYKFDRNRLQRSVAYLAANPSQILNVARMANELEISRDTARRYLEMLSDSLLINLLPSVRAAAHKTITAHPKLAVFDTGFAAWAAGVAADRLLFDGRVWGGLVENLVGLEVAVQASWAGAGTSVGHWRQGNDEVDLLLTDLAGNVVGIEVKAAKTVSGRDTRGLQALNSRLGERFTIGLVLYTGSGRYPIDDKIWAVPISDLWSDRG